jgi:outer membrane protein TolC
MGQLRNEIDAEKRKVPPIIDNIKRARRRLSYKLAEKEAMAKLAAMSKDRTKDIGYLRRRKEKLEFRIATEAFTLDAEKELIRQKNAIEEELNKAIKSFRLKRKVEFIDKDIEQLKAEIEKLEVQINEVDKRLDELYGNLRKLTGQQRRRAMPPRERKEEPLRQPEISLADIATIKDKTKEGKGNGA